MQNLNLFSMNTNRYNERQQLRIRSRPAAGKPTNHLYITKIN